MDDRRRSGLSDGSEQLIGLADIALERNGDLAELRGQVAADEAGSAGDEDRAYRPSSPSSFRMPLSSKARRCARIRFWTASFEITVE